MKKILVLLPNNLGDVIMALPVVEGLKIKYPESVLSFFVEEGFEGGLLNSKFCENIIAFNRKNIRTLCKSENWVAGVNQLHDFIKILREEEFDLVLNLCQIQYVSHIAALVNGKKVMGQKFLPEGNYCITGNWSTYLYTIPYARNFNALHATDVYKRIAGVADVTQYSGIRILSHEFEKIKSYINSKLPGKNNPIAVFHPGAAYDSKRWPVENFVTLGREIIKSGFDILITGAESEKNIAEGIQAQLGERCIVTSGELTFRESMVLLSFSEFCVTSDTAMMHAASSLNKKVYALFGPTNPVETGPYSAGNIVFAGRCNQRPCFCFQCKTKICMRSISPQTVYSFIYGRPEKDASCDVFRTTFQEGVYALIPIIQKGVPYYSDTGAVVTQKALENSVVVNKDSIEFKEIFEESKHTVAIIKEMQKHLELFLNTGVAECIQNFEKTKKLLSSNNGIGKFWTAFLNIQLNSVPLIDPIYGIKENIRICEDMANRIEEIISV